MAQEFIHLHNHTEFSLLDGATQVPQLAERVRALGMPGVAMTDHGNLFGAVNFYKAMQKASVRPIIGCEVYMAPSSRHDRKIVDQTEIAYHLVLLAMDETGYRNLCRLVTAGYMEGFYYKPRIDWELLRAHSEGLICLSGCLQGEVAKAILNGDPDTARAKAKALKEIFGDRFYLEIQANGLPEQEQVNAAKKELARELDVELVATNDNHYLNKDDALPHDVLLCIGTRKLLDDPERMRFPNQEFYVKSADEMWETFRDTPAALDNTLRIAERADFAFDFNTIHLPRFAEEGADLDGMLEESARRGLEERFAEMDALGKTLDIEQQRAYRERLQHELTIIRQMGFSGYFLIVSDFIRWAKSHQIPVGPGRGSAAGSLVSYAIRITEVDPLRFGLLFERFLNPERASMPDIDVDICMNRRGEVIDYVSERYGGGDHVAHIGAFGTAKGRQIYKDVGRVLGLSFGDTDRITKLMPAPPADFKLAELRKQDDELRKSLAEDRALEQSYDLASRLEGITRHATVHAAGVVVSDRPLVDYLPLYKGDHDESVTQFDMKAVEEIGLVKFDFLGLKTLTAMQTTVELIKQTEGVEIDLDALPEDDPKTYQLLAEGGTSGVFQLESDGMQRLLKQLQPQSIDEIIALIALYRPGPLQSGMVDEYVDRKYGRKPVTYPLPELEPILKETYGVIVYQEQVMRIARTLAGYSMGEADLLRKAMGKKDAETMQKQRTRFVDGCVDNGIAEQTARELFDLIVEFAGYGFNKSHSAAYGMIAYATAYLKAHYPVHFMAALLQCDRDKSDKVIPLLRETRQMGIDILPPDINESGLTFTPVGDKIRFGLAAIKNVGEGPVRAILAAREAHGRFTSLETFLEALDSGVLNRKTLEGFLLSGSLDTFGLPRRMLMDNVERILEWAAQRAEERRTGQRNLFGGGGNDDDAGNGATELTLTEREEWPVQALAEGERRSLGFYLSAHPIAPHREMLKRFANTTLADEALRRFGDRSRITFGAVITDVSVKNSPKGRRAFLTLEDLAGTLNVGVFGDTYHEHRDLLEPGQTVLLSGDLMVDAEGGRRVFAKSIVPIEQAEARFGTEYHIVVEHAAIDKRTSLRMAEVLRSHPGKLDVWIHVRHPQAQETVIRLPHTTTVTPSPALRDGLEGLFRREVQTFVHAGRH